MPRLYRKKLRSVGKFGAKENEFFEHENDIDIIAVYRMLKKVAEIPVDKIMDRFELMKMINSAAISSRSANKLWLIAKRESALFDLEYNRALRELSKKATIQITEWMEREEVKKQITKDLIEQEMSNYEEYNELIKERERLSMIKDDCKQLALEWSDRKWTLRTQAQLLTAEKELILKGAKDNEDR